MYTHTNTCTRTNVHTHIHTCMHSHTSHMHTHTHACTHAQREIKVWVLADSQNGYFHTLQVYTGREGSGEKNLGQKVVNDLTRLLKGKNHHVFSDNFFTSEELLQDLLEDGILACGTDRKDHKGFPSALKQAKLKNQYG